MSGFWMQTYTGRKVDLLAPSPDTITMQDISVHLSGIPRFNAATHKLYSVAEHCLYVSLHVPPEHRLAALLHDAHEAYMGDIIAPVKWTINELLSHEPRAKNPLDIIAGRLHHAICTSLGIDAAVPECVHEADMRTLMSERRDLMTAPPDDWATEHYTPFNMKVVPLRSRQRIAARYYLAVVDCLGKEWVRRARNAQ